MPDGGRIPKGSTILSRPTEKNVSATASFKRFADKTVFSPRGEAAVTANTGSAKIAGSVSGTSSGSAAAGEKARKLSACGRRTFDKTAKCVGGDDETSERRAGTVKRGEETVDFENYAWLMNERLTKECQSYFDCNGPASTAPTLSADALTALQKRVQNAVQEKKIFSVHGYYPIISEEFKKRGWVEKRDPEFKPLNYEHLVTSLSTTNGRGVANIESPPSLTPTTVNCLVKENIENTFIWSVVKYARPNILFTKRTNCFGWNTLSDITTNQLGHLNFCSKAGLAQTVEELSKEVNLKFPRAYKISNQRTLNDFKKDYRLTAVLGSLKIILDSKISQKIIFNANGTIPYEMIDFIEQRCWEFVNTYQTEEFGDDILWFTRKLEESWTKFLVWYYEFLDGFATIRLSNLFQINDIYDRFDSLANKIKSFCPQYFIDGDTNLWIMKPPNSCSGKGIKLERNFDNILKILGGPERTEKTYVIQKYIEKPLQVFNVKVDLRQYFLITNTYPIQIWMYKEGYVRFCARTFSVQDLNEAAHISNVRVQSNYRKYRVSGVPEECMWDFEQLKQYLISIGKGDKWDKSIYPIICETISTVVGKSFKHNASRQFSFQLLGADFVMTENFEPWLIEINNNPGLNPTTSVIARTVTALLKDIVKVTVDFPLNSNTDTGLFENIYLDKIMKHSKKKKCNTIEYYYCKSSKKTKQSNKQSLLKF